RSALRDQASGRRSEGGAGDAPSFDAASPAVDATGLAGGGGTYPGSRRASTPAAATSGSHATNRGPYEWIAAVRTTSPMAMANRATVVARFRPCVTFQMIGGRMP